MVARYDIACDWDGVINSYLTPIDGGRPDHLPDPPVAGAIEWLTQLFLAGKSVIIHSTRFEHHDEVMAHETEKAMREYLTKNGCPVDVAYGLHFWSGEGKPRARVYVDDRGYRFEGTFPSVAELDGLDVWNRNDRTRARAEAKRRAEYDAQAAGA